MIGEALAVACADRAVLARIGGPIGEAARAALALLEREARPEARRALRAAMAAAARAPVPAGLRGVHPSWIEAALAGMPERTRADLARGAEPAGSGVGREDAKAGDPVAVWLVRWACAELPPMPAPDVRGAPRSLDEAVRLPGEALAAWLAEVGADQLALALGAAGGDAVAAAARVVGDRLLRAAARIVQPPRAGALGPARAAIGRCRVALDDRALLLIGARAIAPHTDLWARRRLAVRLPRSLGRTLLDELTAFAPAPVEHAPRWQALAADL